MISLHQLCSLVQVKPPILQRLNTSKWNILICHEIQVWGLQYNCRGFRGLIWWQVSLWRSLISLGVPRNHWKKVAPKICHQSMILSCRPRWRKTMEKKFDMESWNQKWFLGVLWIFQLKSFVLRSKKQSERLSCSYLALKGSKYANILPRSSESVTMCLSTNMLFDLV